MDEPITAEPDEHERIEVEPAAVTDNEPRRPRNPLALIFPPEELDFR